MPSGVHINIVGSGQFEPLVHFLEQQRQANCHVLTNKEYLENKSSHQDGTTLTLVDGQGSKNLQALNIYNVNQHSSTPSEMFAFFNISAGSEIEQMVAELDIDGLFYTDIEPENLSRGIDAILDGELWLPRKILSERLRKRKTTQTPNAPSSGMTGRQKQNVLTGREVEILDLIATGAKNADIAGNLSLSVHTIKTHIYHIYKQLNVRNRMQAVNWASQNLH